MYIFRWVALSVVSCRYSFYILYIVGQYIIKVAWLNAFARKKSDEIPLLFFLWQVGVMRMLSHFYKTFYNMQYITTCFTTAQREAMQFNLCSCVFFMITSFIIRKAGRRSRKAYCRCNSLCDVMLVVVVCHNDRLSSLDLLNDHHDHRHLPKRWSVVEAAIDRSTVKSPKTSQVLLSLLQRLFVHRE